METVDGLSAVERDAAQFVFELIVFFIAGNHVEVFGHDAERVIFRVVVDEFGTQPALLVPQVSVHHALERLILFI